MTRGRTAQAPTDIPTPGWKDVALRVKNKIAEDRISLIAAGVAFYGLLALFPAITAMIAISGLLLDPATVVDQISGLSGMVPQQVVTIVTDQASQVAGSREGGLGLAAVGGLLIAIYSASKGMGSLMQGINVAYNEDETRGFFMVKFVTLALTVALIFGLVVAITAMVGVPAFLSFVDWGPTFEALLTTGLWAGLLVLTIFGLSILYRFAPSRSSAKWRWVSVGAVFGCALWLVGSAGFAFYVANFGSYNESFGTLAGVIVLLMWFWLSAFIILLGAELDAEIEAQTHRDTTTGPAEPMGKRGAEKADHSGEAVARD